MVWGHSPVRSMIASRPHKPAAVVLPLVLLVLTWTPSARACPSCAAGDVSASVGDVWMVGLLGLPILMILAALIWVGRFATREEADR